MTMNRKYMVFAFLIFIAALTSLITGCAYQPRRPARSCQDCHRKEVNRFEEAKNIHTPVEKGNCDACHERHGLVGSLRLKTKEPDLCYSCHEDVKNKFERKYKHGTLDKCSSCHDPHSSNKKFLLIDSGDSLCYKCHDKKDFRKKKVHEALSGGCLTCHDPHSSDNKNILVEKKELLCSTCHDIKDVSFQEIGRAHV